MRSGGVPALAAKLGHLSDSVVMVVVGELTCGSACISAAGEQGRTPLTCC
jgi:hypothetical protein